MGIEDNIHGLDDAERARLKMVRERESREEAEGWLAVTEFVRLAQEYGVSPRPVPALGPYIDADFLNRTCWNGRQIFESSVIGWSFMQMRDPHAVGVDGTLYRVRQDVRRRRMALFGVGSIRPAEIAPIAVESYPLGHLSSSNSYDESGGWTLIEYMTGFLRTSRNLST
ncbi:MULTISPECIES: hypothetical protein [Nocardiaceae]|uniref:hypothetical protein n=1 Tax=Nocardiaceae TaxID=85025 RepID=UPI00114002D4|nr:MULTISPECIES: hypothetical protein [Rhodococcus]